jgi:hypothetical protein
MDYTLNHHPSTLQDGKLFVNFLICHLFDRQFNAPNQRLWPEYHEWQGRYSVTGIYHLVKPSRNTQAYLRQKNLVPFSQWITLTPKSLIHGPFNAKPAIASRSRHGRPSTPPNQNTTTFPLTLHIHHMAIPTMLIHNSTLYTAKRQSQAA